MSEAARNLRVKPASRHSVAVENPGPTIETLMEEMVRQERQMLVLYERTTSRIERLRSMVAEIRASSRRGGDA